MHGNSHITKTIETFLTKDQHKIKVLDWVFECSGSYVKVHKLLIFTLLLMEKKKQKNIKTLF